MKDLTTMTAKELKEMAKEMRISNWWNLKKEKLIEKIKEKADSEAVLSSSEDLSQEAKQSTRAPAKKPNLKLTELTYKGETKTIREWASQLEMPWPTLYDRVNRNGWTVEDAIETPLGQRRPK